MRDLPGRLDSKRRPSFPRSALDPKVGRGPSDQRDTKGREPGELAVQIIELFTLPSLPVMKMTAHWLALTSLSSLSPIRRLPITAAASSTRPGRIMIVRWPSTARLSNSNLVWGWPTATAGASTETGRTMIALWPTTTRPSRSIPQMHPHTTIGVSRRGSKGHSSRVGRLQQGHRGRSKRRPPVQHIGASLFEKRQAPGDRDRAVADYRKVLADRTLQRVCKAVSAAPLVLNPASEGPPRIAPNPPHPRPVSVRI